jgi:hypothetical protein
MVSPTVITVIFISSGYSLIGSSAVFAVFLLCVRTCLNGAAAVAAEGFFDCNDDFGLAAYI